MAEPGRPTLRGKIVTGMKEPWHLDKRVPIAIIAGLMFQFGGFVWYASKLDSRVGYLEEQVSARSMVNERLARMEERLESVREDASEMKQSQINIERMVRNLARQNFRALEER